MAEQLRFEDYELTPSSGELRRHGRIVPLQRQPALALVLLASRRGDLVTRRELRTAIWRDEIHVDFDRGLNFCIRQVRSGRSHQTKAGVSAGLAGAGAVSFVRNVHDAVFGPGATGPHHEAAKRAAVALHDLFY